MSAFGDLAALSAFGQRPTTVRARKAADKKPLAGSNLNPATTTFSVD
jgi:hypothetical protein